MYHFSGRTFCGLVCGRVMESAVAEGVINPLPLPKNVLSEKNLPRARKRFVVVSSLLDPQSIERADKSYTHE